MRNSLRQQMQVEALRTLPAERYVLTRFEVLDAGRDVHVLRTYGTPKLPELYDDAFIVGPRGGRKTLYHRCNF